MDSADFLASSPDVSGHNYIRHKDLPGSRIGLFRTFLYRLFLDSLRLCTHCKLENTVDCR